MSAAIFPTPANPAPPQIHVDLFQAAGSQRNKPKNSAQKMLRYAISPAKTQEIKGTIILLQGRNESIEKYFETISDLNQRGFTVATMDWRGQGGSYRLLKNPARGYINRFKDYCDDLNIFLKTIVLPDCPPPYYIIAHSTGGLVALYAHQSLMSRIHRMVLLSPFLGLRRGVLTDRYFRPLSTLLNNAGLGRLHIGSSRLELSTPRFDNNPFTSDANRYYRNAETICQYPQLGLASPTIRWVAQSLSIIRKINNDAFYENFAIPTLIMTGSADRVVSPQATADFAAKLRCAALINIDGARHELLQEADFYREQCFAAIDAFIPGSNAPVRMLEPDNL